jgi:hypothetical protein
MINYQLGNVNNILILIFRHMINRYDGVTKRFYFCFVCLFKVVLFWQLLLLMPSSQCLSNKCQKRQMANCLMFKMPLKDQTNKQTLGQNWKQILPGELSSSLIKTVSFFKVWKMKELVATLNLRRNYISIKISFP